MGSGRPALRLGKVRLGAVAIAAADRWQGIRFRVHGLALTPGAQYVLFTSIAKDYEQCTLGYSVSWAAVSGKHYRRGKFVSQNNDGDESQWTTQAWLAGTGKDAAFKAWFS